LRFRAMELKDAIAHSSVAGRCRQDGPAAWKKAHIAVRSAPRSGEFYLCHRPARMAASGAMAEIGAAISMERLPAFAGLAGLRVDR